MGIKEKERVVAGRASFLVNTSESFYTPREKCASTDDELCKKF